MSCDWSSYKIKSIQESADAAKKGAADNARELKSLKEQFDRIDRDNKRILRQQDAILEALGRLSAAVDGMHNEMYPKPENTKPALKAPGGAL